MNVTASWWPGLTELVAGLAGCRPDAARKLLDAGRVRMQGPASGSVLNNDGTPVEIAVSVKPRDRSVRLLMDPGHWEGNPVRRRDIAREACFRLAPRLGPEGAQALARVLGGALPDDAAAREWLPAGCLWLGVDLERRGLAVYVSARWGGPGERWWRIAQWLESLSIPGTAWLRGVIPRAEPASVSVLAASQLRVRVYFRLSALGRLADLEIAGMDDPALSYFLSVVVADRALRRTGLLISVSSPLTDPP
ncbi:MAG: hypothetical protein ACP5U2_15880 [Bryobacteraceae bacterium]